MGSAGRLWVLALCAQCIALAGCPRAGGSARGSSGGDGAGGGGDSEGFSIRYPDATATSSWAKVGKPFYAKPNATCTYDNGREARWTMGGASVAKGELPPGLTLEDGVIGGVPKKAGTYKATIEISNLMCAGKPYAGQTVDVLITVK